MSPLAIDSSWYMPPSFFLTALPFDTNTHVCIGAVFYCTRCDHLFIPPITVSVDLAGRSCGSSDFALFVRMPAQLACSPCHQIRCGSLWGILATFLAPGK